MTGSEIGPLFAARDAFAALGGAGACCCPAVAGPVGFGVAAPGCESSFAISPAVTVTGLGTAYSFGI